MIDNLKLKSIEDENARELIVQLINMVESLSKEVRELKEKNQDLRNEVNRLKGEQGKSGTKGNTPTADRQIFIRRRAKKNTTSAKAQQASRNPD